MRSDGGGLDRLPARIVGRVGGGRAIALVVGDGRAGHRRRSARAHEPGRARRAGAGAAQVHADHLAVRPRVVPDALARREVGGYGGDGDGSRHIFLQSTTGQTPIDLTPDSTDDNDQPAFSPDGEHIAFRSSRDGGGIFVMGRTGEAVRRLTRRGFRPTWSPERKGARVHDGERRSGSAEHARTELAVGRQRRVGRAAANRKRGRGTAKLVAAWPAHRLHDARRDRGEHAPGRLDGRSVGPRSGGGHDRWRAQLGSGVVARRQVSVFRQRPWRPDQSVARPDRRAIGEDARPA